MADASTWDKWFAFEMKGKGIEDATKMLERLGKESEVTANKVIANCQKIKAELDKGEKGDFGLAKSVELENEKLVQSLERQKAIFKSGEKWMSQNGGKIELKTSVDIDTTIAEAKMAQLAVDARKASEEVKASFDSESVTKWANDLIASGAPIQQVFDAIEAKMEDIRDEMDMLDYKFGSTEAYGGRASEAVAQDGQAYQALGEIIDKVKEQVIALQEQQFGNKGSSTVIEDSTKGADEASKQVENLNERLQHASETAQKVGSNMQESARKSVGSAFDGLIDLEREPEMLEEIDRRINRIKGDIAEMRENAQSGGSEFNASELAESITEAEKELKRYEKMRSALVGKQETPQNESPKSEGTAQSEVTINALDKMKTAISNTHSMAKLMDSAFKRIGSGAIQATASLATFTKDGVMAMANAIKSVGATAFQGIVNGFNMLNNGARTAISTMVSLGSRGFNAIRSGAQSAMSGVRGLISKMRSLSGKTSQNLLKSFSSIKSMLKRRIKRTFISSIFNQAKEGIQQLAKYSSAFNSVMSSIKSSAKQASGNLAVAMGNIISMLAPAIQWLLNALSALFEKLNAIFALLTGKSTVTTAKKQTDNYAQSLDNAGGSAKDLNKQLYGFDELTRQDDNSGGGGGGKIEYEESDIGGVLGGLKDAFDQIKQAFENGEYERVGELIAEQLNKIIYKIDKFLVDLRPKAVQWSKIVARILNGLVSKWDASATGKMLAHGLNLVFDTINTFLETFKFDVLGMKLAQMVNGMFDHIEWSLVGKTIANYFNAFWRTLSGFVTNAKWRTYGVKFGVAVNSFFSNFDFEAIETSIVEGLNGVVDSLQGFVDTVRWNKISKDLSASMKRVVNGIKWEDIGKLIYTSVNNAFVIAKNLLADNTIVDLFSGIGTTLGTALNEIKWNDLGEIVSTGLAQVQKGFTEFVKNLDLPNLGSELASGVQTMLDNIDWDARKEAILTGFNSVIDGIKNFIDGVEWTEFAKNFAENTNSIIDGVHWDTLAGTVSTGINKLTSAFDELVKSDVIVHLGERLGDTVGGILDGINWTNLAGTIDRGIAQLVEAFGALLSGLDLENTATKIAEGINSLFTDGEDGTWSKAIKAVTSGVNSVIAGIKKLVAPASQGGINFSQIRITLRKRITGLVQNVDWAGLISSIGIMIQEVATTFWSMVGAIFEPDEETGKTLGDKIADGINGIFKNEQGEVDTDKFKGFGETLGNAVKGFIENIGDLVSGIDWGAFQESFTALMTGIPWTNILKSLIDTASKFIVAAFKGTQSVITAIVQALKEIDWLEVGKAVLEGIFKILPQAVESLGGIWKEIWELIINKTTGGGNDVDWSGFDNAVEKHAEELGLHVMKIAGGITQYSPSDAMMEYFSAERDKLKDSLLSQGGYLTADDIDKYFNLALNDITVSPDSTYADIIEQIQNRIESYINGVKNSKGDYTFDWDVCIEPNTYLADVVGEDGVSDELRTNALQYLGSVMSGIREEFESQIPNMPNGEAIAKLNEWVDTLAQNIELSGDSWVAVKQAFDESGITVSDAFAQAITGKGAEDIGMAIQMLGAGVGEEFISSLPLDGINDTLTAWMNASGATLEETIVYLMALMGEDVTDFAGTVGSDVGDKLGSTIPDALKESLAIGESEVKEAEQKLAEAASVTTAQAKDMRETGESAVGDATDAMQTEMESGKDGVGTATDNVTKTIDDKIKELPEKEQANAKKMMDMLLEGILEGDPLVQQAIETSAQAVVDRASEIMSGSRGREIMADFLGGMKAEIDESFETDIYNNIASWCGQIVNAMDARINWTNGYTIMTNIFNGMEDAIYGGRGQEVVNAFGDFCQAIIDTTHNYFQWGSPSRVFEKIGGYLMDGLEMGIEDNGANALDAIANVSKAIVEEGDGMSLDSNISTSVDGLDTVATKFERVAEIFSGIADTIAKMGGLELPNIATGRSIPYRAQTAMSVGAGVGVSDTESLEDALYSAFTRALNSDDTDQKINITLMIDGRKMADIVSKYQRQQKRAWGV